MCSDFSATETFAETLGRQLKGGEVIELVGDVGAGKTTFVKGLAAGAGSKDNVSSPTFTLQQVYRGRVNMYHFDFYRLHEAGLIAHELEESLEDPAGVVVVEWGETIKDSLPEDRLVIRFEVASENERRLLLTVPEKYKYLGAKS